MKITVDLGALRRIRWYEYALRFFFGGAITAAAGLVAKGFGPEVGGLLLAFPAIFPASVTLVERNERLKARQEGRGGAIHGRHAAAVEAAGAAMGSYGLLPFAIIVWLFVADHPAALVLPAASLAWGVTAFGIWRARHFRHG